jgi:putative membrane protein
MRILIKIIVNSIAVYVAAMLVPGVVLTGILTAVVVSIVLGILNTILKPILLILSLPITILTLGLFTFVINAIIILLASGLVGGFSVDGFWTAVLFSIVLSIVSWFLHVFIK